MGQCLRDLAKGAGQTLGNGGDAHAPIVYPVARIAASTHPRARNFVQWLQSREARAIFARHGFTPL